MKKEKLQSIVNGFFSKLGNEKNLVSVEVLDDSEIFARARGIKLFNIPFGQICVSKQLIDSLTDEELEFVLAHEVVHIDQNHLPITVITKLPKLIFDALARENQQAAILSLGINFIDLFIYWQGNLPLEAAITKQQELQADIWAIFLTGNKTAAINCLKKFVNNNLDQPSHLWEIMDVKLPVMTMRERINEIINVIKYHEERGYTFR